MRTHHVRQENLPFVGSSYEFRGAEQGDMNVSVFLFQKLSAFQKNDSRPQTHGLPRVGWKNVGPSRLRMATRDAFQP
jgi:hypothetical protein